MLAIVDRPRWWVLSLAGFLVRGGVLLLALPIWILPTPAQLSSLLGPSVLGAGLASPTPALIALLVGALVLLTIVLLATSLLGGSVDADLLAAMAADEELGGVGVPTVPADIAATARLMAHLPTLAATVLAGSGLLQAATIELLNPAPSADSLAARIAAHVPVPLGLVVAAWVIGEAWGGLALRELATRPGLASGLLRGLRRLVSPSGLATLVVTDSVVLGVAAGMWLVLGRAFDRVWPAVLDGADPASLVVPIALLAATWVAALWLISLATAWRAAAWTAISFGDRNRTVTRTPRRAS